MKTARPHLHASRRQLVAAAAMLLLVSRGEVWADLVELKSGKSVKGDVLREDDRLVVVLTQKGLRVLDPGSVSEVRRGSSSSSRSASRARRGRAARVVGAIRTGNTVLQVLQGRKIQFYSSTGTKKKKGKTMY